MTRLRRLSSGLVVCLSVVGSAVADVLVLENLVLIDGTGGEARAVDALVVDDGRIAAIVPAGAGTSHTVDAAAERLDLGGAVVMPGLIDTHVHVARFPDTRVAAAAILAQALRGGVTSVRDMGGDVRALQDIARARASGEFVGPTVVASAVVGGPTLFADPRIARLGVGYPVGEAPWARAVTPTLDERLAVAEAKGAGAGGLKLYGDLARADAARMIAEARAQGLGTWAHATVFPARPGDLVDAGIGSLSHAPYLVWEAIDRMPDSYEARTKAPWRTTPADDGRLLRLYDRMAANNVYLDATLYVFAEMHTYSPDVEAAWTAEATRWGKEATRLAHRRGVGLTTGTDWFEPRENETLPHTHDEMAILVHDIGLTPMEAIVAATRNGADALGILDDRGTVEVGKAADLLVLSVDPLQDIANTRRIRRVFKDGVAVAPVSGAASP